ncbi:MULTISPECIES: MarR family winged helix-turn-helix transcriptional regulator [Rhodobacterales]|uniref:MarR family winged helix-turn-helix transcriptional regulator n=1 Tax=Rhodobacterales TaxID=204455 RepID=UPI000C118081|nr:MULTISPECIES: MarR family transcriptional regulator [Rhodobacterales]NDW59338.1 MarR family transcriptional regulator [Salipiger sp. PrR004]PHR00149.1 MAG: MarR family transcriptional regulator [Sulfitobacter sp.]MBN8292542.1 MarR family transcriptional regulator [Rhodobacter sp. NTK016B]MCD1620774.1 MarR family transcriptional regulator [Salipiger manganoxidans]NDW02299.1 MarR family transcriptional regulator [Salipiger sp. PrR002]
MDETAPSGHEDFDPKLTKERLARLVRLAARAFNRSLQMRLQDEGITFGQWIFLRILWYNDGLSQRELSQRAHLTEPTAHAALTKLEKQGVITRQKMDGNKRTLRIFLTPKGWELRDRLEPMAHDVNLISLKGLEEDEVRVLRKGLLAIITNLEADENAAAEQGIKVPATRSSF